MRRKIVKNNMTLQSTIPSEIVQDLQLRAGDKLDFSIVEEYIKVVPVRTLARVNEQAAQPARETEAVHV